MRFLVRSGYFVFLLISLSVMPAVALAQDASDIDTQGITAVTIFTQEWEDDTNADMTGIYWETLLAVFEPLDIKLDVTFMPYSISIVRVREKQCDIALSGYMEEYPDVLYPKWPHEVEAVFVLHRKETPYRSANDLVGKKSAWIKDYHFEQFLPSDIEFSEVRSIALGLRTLERGRVDFFFDYPQTITETAAEMGLDLSTFEMTPVKALAKPVYPMFRNDQRGAQLRAIYDQRMAELHKNGTLDQIFAKHGKGKYPAPQ